MKFALVCGSTTVNAARAAPLLLAAPGEAATMCRSIHDTAPEELARCDGLILGPSTWKEGEMPERWKDFPPEPEAAQIRPHFE